MRKKVKRGKSIFSEKEKSFRGKERKRVRKNEWEISKED